jgi:hypothetical protein
MSAMSCAVSVLCSGQKFRSKLCGYSMIVGLYEDRCISPMSMQTRQRSVVRARMAVSSAKLDRQVSVAHLGGQSSQTSRVLRGISSRLRSWLWPLSLCQCVQDLDRRLWCQVLVVIIANLHHCGRQLCLNTDRSVRRGAY